MRANLLEFAMPEVASVVSGRKNFKFAATSVGRQTLRKQPGGAGEQKRSNPTKSLKQNSRSRREFLPILEIKCYTSK